MLLGCRAVLRAAAAASPARLRLPRRLGRPCPALSGGGSPPAAILGGFSCRRRCSTFPPPKKGRWGRRRASYDSCPLPFPSAKPHRKAVGAKCFRSPQGKRLTAGSASPRPSVPTGEAAIFPQHKMAARGPGSSPTRKGGYRESSRMRRRRPPPAARARGGPSAQRALWPPAARTGGRPAPGGGGGRLLAQLPLSPAGGLNGRNVGTTPSLSLPLTVRHSGWGLGPWVSGPSTSAFRNRRLRKGTGNDGVPRPAQARLLCGKDQEMAL